MTTSLVTELERLAAALDVEGSEPVQIPLEAVAEKIAKNLGVQADEVAILGVSTRWRHLHFLVPQALKNVGFIPMSSTSALAARTARENRADFVRGKSGGSDADQPERRDGGGSGRGFYGGGFGKGAGVVPAVGEVGEAFGGGVGKVTGEW
jgi:hypothetical protein